MEVKYINKKYGDIAIHYNYSVLLCKDKDVLDKTPQENIWWYVTTIDKFI
jgi:hypothetical protein